MSNFVLGPTNDKEYARQTPLAGMLDHERLNELYFYIVVEEEETKANLVIGAIQRFMKNKAKSIIFRARRSFNSTTVSERIRTNKYLHI